MIIKHIVHIIMLTTTPIVMPMPIMQNMLPMLLIVPIIMVVMLITMVIKADYNGHYAKYYGH